MLACLEKLFASSPSIRLQSDSLLARRNLVRDRILSKVVRPILISYFQIIQMSIQR